MIVSFGDRATEDLYHGRNTARIKRFPRDIVDAAQLKMDILDAAATLLDLRSPPGNHLEALKGDLSGFHSIRVNGRWRLVFRWSGHEVRNLRLMDYH